MTTSRRKSGGRRTHLWLLFTIVLLAIDLLTALLGITPILVGLLAAFAVPVVSFILGMLWMLVETFIEMWKVRHD